MGGLGSAQLSLCGTDVPMCNLWLQQFLGRKSLPTLLALLLQSWKHGRGSLPGGIPKLCTLGSGSELHLDT